METNITSLPIAVCASCQGSGKKGAARCPKCKGFGMGRRAREKWLYFGYPLTRYHLAFERVRRIFNKIRYLTIVVVGVNFWVWAGVFIFRRGGFGFLFSELDGPILFLRSITKSEAGLFWLGILCFSYLWYRAIREKEVQGLVEHFDYDKPKNTEAEASLVADWRSILHTYPSKKRHDISACYTREALQSLGVAYHAADQYGDSTVSPIHLFYALLSLGRVANIFVRLGISATAMQKELTEVFTENAKGRRRVALAPTIGAEFRECLFIAYERAYEEHQEYVSVTELLEAVIAKSPALQEVLFDYNVDMQKLDNVVEWARVRERLHRQYITLRSAGRHRSKHGMDKAMTAVATPYLNQFSDDLTILAQFGGATTCVAREKEIEEVFRVVEGGVENVLLVGDFGVGKRTIVEGIAEKMVEDDVPNRLKDKRLVRLSTSSLLAGTTPSGAVERLIHIMSEIGRAGNIILFIHNIHEITGVSAGGEGGKSLDVASTLAEYISGGRFMTIATTTVEAYAQTIVNSALGNVFTKVEVPEMDINQAIQVLESKVAYIEYKHQVFFSYAAIEKAVTLAKRFMHDQYLPGSALEILTEAGSFTHNHKGAHSLVTPEEVESIIAAKTHVPVTTVSADESTKLLHLEEAMHRRVVGQEEAVSLIASALRRARAEMRSQNRPIANFLFLGPTGVGKTELAKTIAEVYFGGENRMIRLDMSEYQDTGSIYRLIGAPNQKGTGVLTEAVRRSPFALILLDEIEKADKDILNLFLQVMDDGRLSDSTGRVIDFTNVILVATSNAGTSFVQEQMRNGLSSEAIKEQLLHGQLKENFKPEFLNRFDGIVLFKALSEDDIKHVAVLMLERVAKELELKGISLEITSAAVEYLAQVGFDPEFGARPMRRAVQERVENKLAELILGGQLKRRDTVVFGEGGELQVKK